MDSEPEDLQFLGFFGICREVTNLTVACRSLFVRIAAALIAPLSFLFLLHVQISDRMFSNINRDTTALDKAPDGSASEDALVSRVVREWGGFFLFKAAYLVGVLVFALLSTAAVVYTIASVYTAKDVSFRKILTVVPKVWRRLMVTFLFSFAILFVYNLVALVLLALDILFLGSGTVGTLLFTVIFMIYLIGLVYISILWHLASVISVLEDRKGAAAMRKSQQLIKGKERVVALLFLLFQFLFVGVEVLFGHTVVKAQQSGLGFRLGFALLLLVVITVLVLLALVAQTVVYFVCKSFHHESIDKGSLADHLEVYMGEYVPLKGRAVQLEQFDI